MGVPEQHRRSPGAGLSLLLFLTCLLSFSPPTSVASAAATTAGRPGTRWTTPVILGNDGTVLHTFLVAEGGPGPAFAFGFFKRPGDGYLLGVFLVSINNFSTIVSTTPEVVWTANRNRHIFDYAALDLTTDGDLRLSDGGGRLVWSTKTSGQGVASLNLTMKGNLVLLNAGGRVVWQSYNHPTDTALRNQSLTGLTLVANSSATNSSEGAYYLSITNSSYEAYILGDPGSPDQMYYTSDKYSEKKLTGGILLQLPLNSSNQGRVLAAGTLSITYNGTARNRTGRQKFDYSVFAKGFVRLEADGHLREYVWREDLSVWQPERSLLDDNRNDCGYPKVCGRYGICSEGECSCPQEDETDTNYFQPVEDRKPKQGCSLLTDLLPSCATQAPDPRQKMVLYKDISYFGYVRKADIERVKPDLCKQVCAGNCSCKAAFFKYGLDNSIGDCYLVSTVLSVIWNDWNNSRYNSSAYIKVQQRDTQKSLRHFVIPLIISLIGVFTLAGACFGCILYRRKTNLIAKANKLEEEDADFFRFEHLPGMPTKFTYAELKDATEGFSKKLGEGGFGAVFKGTLRDGTQVAVKMLGYRGQGMKEFLAEVETIGSIHHLNLVKLVGYCAERLHRLLVYEYLSNGSLENWIFHDKENSSGKSLLDLDTKMKIILQVAKGLAYLHEECRHRIIHLDIKPQNILLDDYFNVKVSDFGLSKLVERDQSQVVTTMRGTPGYLAPEWLHSVITEKVDVYSFGVVVLETVSGKKVLDYSRSQGSINLLQLLSNAAAEERLKDMIGADNEDEVAMRLVKIAMWCLHMDYTKRPSMSDVVKALEGVMKFEPTVDFWVPVWGLMMPSDVGSTSMSTALLSSVVAEPR